MTTFRIGTLMLALGLALGSGTTLALKQPSIALAQQSMGSMAMKSKSAGDSEMNAVMPRMMQTMSTAKLTGDQDHDFMLMMIPHHQSAVDMANIELRRGKRSQLKALARNIITSQVAEIAQMRGWLQTWYGYHL